MFVKLTVYPQGGIDCMSKTCQWRKECANHYTAGDFRYEDGVTPKLEIINMFLGGADAECTSQDTNEFSANGALRMLKNNKLTHHSAMKY